MTAPTMSPQPAPAAPPRPPLGGVRIALVVVGSLTALLGLMLVVASGVLGAIGRSSDGYLEAGPGRFTTETYAITVPGVGIDIAGPDVAFARDMLGAARVRAESHDGDVPVFIGIGPREDVSAYLSGVEHAEVSDVEIDPFRVDYRSVEGGAPADAPDQQTFWAVSDAGAGERTVEWEVAPGDWTVVVMNADGSAGVDADVTLGASMRIMGVAGVGVLVAGLVLLVVGIVLVVVPLVTRGRRTA